LLLVQFSYQMAVTQPTFTNIDCGVSNRYTSDVLSATEQEGKMITKCECRINIHGLRKAMRHPSLHTVRPEQKPESLPVQPTRPSRMGEHRGSALANVSCTVQWPHAQQLLVRLVQHPTVPTVQREAGLTPRPWVHGA